jgi:hypothetical protein
MLMLAIALTVLITSNYSGALARDGLLGAQGAGLLGANVAVEESSAVGALYVVVLVAMTGMLLLAWDWDFDELLKE